MKELLRKGRNGALLKVCDNETKYELVSAFGYDEATQSWSQGHYFTLWYGEITEANKEKLYTEANKHFEKHYM